jgi:DNA (cytosine-5)-methyltransferase 1
MVSENIPAEKVDMSQQPPFDLLRQARARYSQSELATLLEVDVRAVRRREVRENDPPPYLTDAIRQRLLPLMAVPAEEYPFWFVDLFAGIGGIRLGFEAHGGHCVFTSEWNAFAQKTYLANFPVDDAHVFAGNITLADLADVRDHDVLIIGFSTHTSRHARSWLSVLFLSVPRAARVDTQ